MNFPEPFFRWRPHPWHGLPVGCEPPEYVNAFIELTPFDLVKYEVHKPTGFLRVDRPQRTSSTPPTLYGFIPRTYCGKRVGEISGLEGDGDPLDICVISERPINRGEIIIETRVVGGLRMIDGGLADDKIVAVLRNDAIWGEAADINEVPSALIERLQHYFETYKLRPGEHPGEGEVSVREVYDRSHAVEVIQASIEDYDEQYGSA
ncbi:MAG: inorganic pyrophosphatase [Phycisphaerales bacterium]|nr:inorganic pyrophosphatase [Phycisphaerales bacterium]